MGAIDEDAGVALDWWSGARGAGGGGGSGRAANRAEVVVKVKSEIL